jgi:hypothetical protein
MRLLQYTLLLGALLISTVCGAHSAVTGRGDLEAFEAVNPPHSGFVGFVSERDNGNLVVQAKWSRTASACMHVRDTVTLELLDVSGKVIDSAPAKFHPQIRSLAYRDKVWVLERRFSKVLPEAATLRVRFQPRSS